MPFYNYTITPYKVGDKIRVLECPRSWSSGAGGENPRNLSYPRVFEIAETRYSHDHWSLRTIDGFGLDMETLGGIAELVSSGEQVVSPAESKLKLKKSNRMKPKIKISLEKDGSKVSIKIKIPKELEEFFKTLAEGKISVSQKWLKGSKGAEFYNLTEEYDKVKDVLATNIINDFGNGLYFNGQINIAPLRCVGASLEKGIELSSARNWDISGLDLEYYIRELGNTAKKIWQGFIAKSKVKAVISFEL